MWQELLDEVRDQQALFDVAVREWVAGYALKKGTLHCGRGCHACCSLAVNCTFTEALAVSTALADRHAAALAHHAAAIRAAAFAAPDFPSFLRARRALGDCPFLDDDGACGVYGRRPFSCRSLLSTKESRWCGADFATLSREEKRAFMESLDQTVTAFPMHYVKATQDMGQEFEERSAGRMIEAFGFSLYGNLPALVFLEREHRLSEAAATGRDAVREVVERAGYSHPFLVSFLP
ncbi:YkgJ family cysteine cluster protein [Geobacter hydrogenophilus]|uniref:Zinc/iron-chelating domain-containing protein n=1 Tax=Geobacter hydrogenophilus TaxID=40983 RepID=A0A9W6LC37_9BACT|nr:YkgJ family cysteine cluster protein [Geobacter hydrogenophilus]MBT0894709.1 YkgJ family cysteine cluster protein [Geobacter hydrogenophilus]GLI37454.1 zinc/iron-chelating domain-containing protein [Geobacter hydrogenophilus]